MGRRIGRRPCDMVFCRRCLGAAGIGNAIMKESDTASERPARDIVQRLLGLAGSTIVQMHDRHPGTEVELTKAGFALYLFNSGERGAPNWHAGLSVTEPERLAPPGLRVALGDFSLHKAFFIVSEARARLDAKLVPEAFWRDVRAYRNQVPRHPDHQLLVLERGVNFLAHATLPSSGRLGFINQRLGFRGECRIHGVVGRDIIGGLLRAAGRGGRGERGERGERGQGAESLARDTEPEPFSLTVSLPTFAPRPFPLEPPASESRPHLQFEDMRYQIRREGREVAVSGQQTLRLRLGGREFCFLNALALESGHAERGGRLRIEGAVASDALSSLTFPFHEPWLPLSRMGVTAEFALPGDPTDDADEHLEADEEPLLLGFHAVAGIGEQEVRLAFQIGIAAGARIEAPSLRVQGAVDVGQLPLLGRLPGARDFAFADLELTPGMLAGTVTWKPRALSGAGALCLGSGASPDAALYLQVEDFAIARLFAPDSLRGPLGQIAAALVLPAGILALRSGGGDLRFEELPWPARKMFLALSDELPRRFTVPTGMTVAV